MGSASEFREETTALPEAVSDLKSLDSRRVGARLLDGLVVAAVTVGLDLLVHGGDLPVVVISLWVAVTYFFLCEAFWGQTLGKRVAGLRVVRRDGSPATANSIAARNVIRVFEEPFIALIALVASGRRRRQRIGDLAGGTTVGRAHASLGPPASPLRVIYPAVWAVCGGLLVWVGSDVDRQPPDPNSPAALLAYDPKLAKACTDHQFQVTDVPSDPEADLIHALEIERAANQRLGRIDPPTVFAFQHQILMSRSREMIRELQVAYDKIRDSKNQPETFRVVAPRLVDAAHNRSIAWRQSGVDCAGPTHSR